MKKIRNEIIIFLIIIGLMAIYGCQKEDINKTPEPTVQVTPDTTTDTAIKTGKVWKVAMIMPGRVNDVSWNAAGYNGLKDAEKNLSIKFAYTENVAVPDAETALRGYAEQGYDLILAHSFNYKDAVNNVAKDYPDIKFGWATGDKASGNITIYDWPANQAGYLAGMLAASMSKTNRIGATGGFDVPDVVRALEGFKLGAKAVKPDIEVYITYLNEWDDIAKGKEAVMAQIEQGADIIYCNGDGISIGCIQACKEKGVYAIGGIADQNELAPDTVITSTVLKVDTTIAGMIKDLEAGKFKDKYLYDMPGGGVDLAPYHGFEKKIPEETKTLISETREKILKGELKIPDIVKKID